MCGIAGFVGAGDRDDLARMTAALAHRGPDGEGFHRSSDARVSRPSPSGHPRSSSGGSSRCGTRTERVGVVFNGEIYNHAELRRRAGSHAVIVFRTDHSDTEVLVHGYEEWGQTLPARLNGMFAFAIYDRAAPAPVPRARPLRRKAALLLRYGLDSSPSPAS